MTVLKLFCFKLTLVYHILQGPVAKWIKHVHREFKPRKRQILYHVADQPNP